jgi:hypothetical protein
MFVCKICQKVFSKKESLSGHMSAHNRKKYITVNIDGKILKKRDRNKIPQESYHCNHCYQQFNEQKILNGHKVFCKKNPNYEENLKKLREGIKSIPHTIESKNKISDGMVKAHKELRAWNIGKSRWNNKKSYPEKFFEKCILNEFDDKNYQCEYPFKNYSFDFAWEHTKRVIEIDGEQHYRFIDL